MRAVVLDEYGSLDNLAICDMPDPRSRMLASTKNLSNGTSPASMGETSLITGGSKSANSA